MKNRAYKPRRQTHTTHTPSHIHAHTITIASISCTFRQGIKIISKKLQIILHYHHKVSSEDEIFKTRANSQITFTGLFLGRVRSGQVKSGQVVFQWDGSNALIIDLSVGSLKSEAFNASVTNYIFHYCIECIHLAQVCCIGGKTYVAPPETIFLSS